MAVVRRIRTPGVRVYDIQVEGNRNFFANEILVHNCLIIDDPIKNAEEAGSATIRAKHKEWWRSTAYTRLEPGAAAVVMCTRWNEDDLPGWLISESRGGGERWDVLNLPALAEEDDPLGRSPGEALWPERYPAGRLAEIRNALGTYWFTALYQGRPTPIEGGLIRRSWLPIVEARPEGMASVRAWDLAATADGDYSAGVRMGRTGDGRFVIEDVVRGQWSPHERDRVILQTAALDGKDVPIWIEQEPGSAGVSVIAAMVRMLAGYTIRGERATGDKVTRVGPFAAQAEAGNVRLLKGEWNRDLIEELAVFDNGKFDDQVDATSLAFGKSAIGSFNWDFY